MTASKLPATSGFVAVPSTICAPATSSGGALSIIRISGPEAITIADSIFHSRTPLTAVPTHTTHYGTIHSPVLGGSVSEVIDESLATVFRAPNSYTGEDSVEFSCHGSPYIVSTVLRLLCDNGCCMAAPGEFTQRAFMNGKMDLTQAEAVADLIASSSQAAHRMAFCQLKGGYSKELAELRSQLLHLTSLLELELDFSDHEELEFADRAELIKIAEETLKRVTRLRDSFRQGNAIKNGIPVVIVGPPNAGKSTLLNALLSEEKAIVSDIPGTTRDYIEGLHTINGHLFRFIDTAGLRKTDDKIENLGIERTKSKMEEADIIISIEDATVQPSSTFRAIIEEKATGKHLIRLANKIDIEPLSFGGDDSVLSISAKTGHNIDKLCYLLSDLAESMTHAESNIIIANARHHEALSLAATSIQRVLDSLNSGLSTDLVAQDLRETLHHLAEITGDEITNSETLQNIFSHFCIGK